MNLSAAPLSALVAIIALGSASAQVNLPPIVYSTATELHATLAIPGDEQIIVADRAAGLFRVGFLDSSGVPVWIDEPVNAGMRDLDGGAFAPDGVPDRDFFAITNVNANRINRFSFDAARGLLAAPSILTVDTAGKRAVAAFRLPGLTVQDSAALRPAAAHDLIAFDAYTSPTTAFAEMSLRRSASNDFTGPVVFDLPSSHTHWANWLVTAIKPALTEAIILRSDTLVPGNTVFLLATVTGASGPLTFYDELLRGPDARAVYGDLLPSGAPVFVFWEPGVPTISILSWSVASMGFSNTPGFEGDLDFELGHLAVVAYEGHPALLAIDASATKAALYVLDSAATPLLAESLDATGAARFTGVLSTGGDRLHLLTGGEDGRTTGVQTHEATSGLNHLASSPLPPLPALARGASLLVYDGVPFIDNNVQLLVRRDAGVWTSAFSIFGSDMKVTAESFLSAEGGLGNPDDRLEGPPPPDIGGALTNQIADNLSFFSLTAPEGTVLPEARISPPPGTYDHAVALSFETTGDAFVVYRPVERTNWALAGPAPAHIMQSTTVYYLTVSPGGIGAVREATYVITADPAQQDANGDGLPDFVRLAYGLDPNGPHDTDGDGFSDLAEILAGTDPADGSSFPVTGTGDTDRDAASWSTPSAVAAEIAPLSRRPGASPGFVRSYPQSAAPGAFAATQLRAFDNLGSLLGSAPTTAPSAGDALSVNAARLPNLRVDDGDLFFIFATENNFPIQSGVGDRLQGRELIAARPMVAEAPPPLVYNDFGNLGGFNNIGDEADAWVTAARDYYFNLERPLLTIADMDYRETLAALLMEAFIGEKLYARGQPPDGHLDPETENFPSPFISFTPFRAQENPVPVAEASGDPGQTVIPTRGQMRALRRSPAPTMPAYDLHATFAVIHDAVFNPPTVNIQTLVNVALEIHRLSATQSLDGSLRSPVTALRRLIRYGDLAQTGYTDRPTLPAGIVMDAGDGVTEALALAAPRALSAHFLRIPAEIVGQPFMPLPEVIGFAPDMDPDNAVDSGALLTLLNSAGNPFPLPRAFNLPPGSIIEVNGLFVSGVPGGEFTLEVIPPVVVRHLALPGLFDSEDNLVPDSLQDLFPGTPLDPFADLDGDGFTLLEEIIAGTDPFDAGSSPVGDPLDLGPPVVGITPVNPTTIFEVSFVYPAVAAPHIGFRLYGSDDLETFFDTGLEAIHLGGGQFALTFNTAGDLPAFFTFRMFLK